MHAVVDNGDGRDEHPGPMPNPQPVQPVLQLPDRVAQEPGTSALHEADQGSSAFEADIEVP